METPENNTSSNARGIRGIGNNIYTHCNTRGKTKGNSRGNSNVNTTRGHGHGGGRGNGGINFNSFSQQLLLKNEEVAILHSLSQ